MESFTPIRTKFDWYNKQSNKFNNWNSPKQFSFQNYDQLNPTSMDDVNNLTKQQFDASRARFEPQFAKQNTDMYNQLANRGIGLGSTLHTDLMSDVSRNQGDILTGLEQQAFDKAMDWSNLTFGQQAYNKQSQMAEDQMQSDYGLGYDRLLSAINAQQAQYGLDYDTMMGNEMARRNQLNLSRDQGINQNLLTARGQGLYKDSLGMQDKDLTLGNRKLDIAEDQFNRELEFNKDKFKNMYGLDAAALLADLIGRGGYIDPNAANNVGSDNVVPEAVNPVAPVVPANQPTNQPRGRYVNTARGPVWQHR